MNFIVVLSVDVPKDRWLTPYTKEAKRAGMYITERNEQSDWDFLPKHRKYYGEMSKDKFCTLMSNLNLCPDRIETMGMLTFDGWLPAISFNDYDADASVSAYVCPIPEVGTLDERAWDRVKNAVYRYYGV